MVSSVILLSCKMHYKSVTYEDPFHLRCSLRRQLSVQAVDDSLEFRTEPQCHLQCVLLCLCVFKVIYSKKASVCVCLYGPLMGGKQWPLGTVAMVTVAGQCNVTVAAVTSAGYRTAGVSGSDLSRTHTHTHVY